MNVPGVRLREAGPVQPVVLQGPASKGDVIVGLAGPAANLALAFVGAIVSRWILYAPGAHAGAGKPAVLLLLSAVPADVRAHQPVPHVLQPAAYPAAGRLVHLRARPAEEVPAAVLQECSSYAMPIFLIVMRARAATCCTSTRSSIYLDCDGRQRVQPAVLIRHRIGRRRVVQGSHRQLRGAVRPACCTWSAARRWTSAPSPSRRSPTSTWPRCTRMDNLDLDVASDFLLVASTLLEIKAESLVPRERDRRGRRHRRACAQRGARHPGGPPAHVQAVQERRHARCSRGSRRKGRMHVAPVRPGSGAS